jgi:hypothetical protein
MTLMLQSGIRANAKCLAHRGADLHIAAAGKRRSDRSEREQVQRVTSEERIPPALIQLDGIWSGRRAGVAFRRRIAPPCPSPPDDWISTGPSRNGQIIQTASNPNRPTTPSMIRMNRVPGR